MSADNYFVIHKVTTYVVQMRFASDDAYAQPLRETDPKFNSLSEALGYAFEAYSEYGVVLTQDCLDELKKEEGK